VRNNFCSLLAHPRTSQKASKITHFRFQLATIGFSTLCGVRSTDRIYTPLPLYHSAGGMIGVGNLIYNGAFMVLRRKFSARALGKDVRDHSCT
jgi:solute carrier family 27 fatty acid transporter 1/4